MVRIRVSVGIRIRFSFSGAKLSETRGGSATGVTLSVLRLFILDIG